MLRMKVVYKLLFLVIFIFISCSIKPKTNNDLIKFNLNGKVKSIIEKEYKPLVKFDEIAQGELIDNYSQTIFNEEGGIIERNIYSTEDSLISKLKYYYDENNNLKQIKYFNVAGKKDSSFVFEYNDYCKIISEKVTNQFDKITKITTCNYDEKNNLAEKIKYNLELLKVDMIERYHYDENNVLKEIALIQDPDYQWIYHYNNNKEIDKKYIDGSDITFSFKYEDSTKITQYFNGALFLINEKIFNYEGRLIKETVLRPDNSIKEFNSYEYDERGNVIQESDKYYTKTINQYDESNNKIGEKEYNENGNIENSFKYDKNGNTIELIYYSGRDKWKYTYTYDENNNVKTFIMDLGFTKASEHYGYWYDDNHNIVKKVDLYKQDTKEEYDYTYQRDGKILEVTKFKYQESKRIPQYYKKYDINDNVIEKREYDYYGILNYHTQYDNNENLVKSNIFDDTGNLMGITNYFYNDEDQIMSKIIHSINKKERTIIFTYDENKNKIEENFVDSNNNVVKANYTYNENNFLTFITILNSINNSEMKEKYTYQVDSKNNWILKIVKNIEGKPQSMIKRIINYY